MLKTQFLPGLCSFTSVSCACACGGGGGGGGVGVLKGWGVSLRLCFSIRLFLPLFSDRVMLSSLSTLQTEWLDWLLFRWQLFEVRGNVAELSGNGISSWSGSSSCKEIAVSSCKKRNLQICVATNLCQRFLLLKGDRCKL